MTNYIRKGNVLILGDLNARIGMDKDQQVDIPILDDITPHKQTMALDRSSCDPHINKYGKKLKQLCQGLGLTIANGRAPGDLLGNFTCYNNGGSSVVDYVICDSSFFKRVKKMKVQAPVFSSAHTPLEVLIDCKVSVSNKVEKAPLPPAPRIKWDPYKAELLKAEIASSTNKEKLATINENLSKAANTNEIDRYAKELTNLLFDTSTKVMKLAKKGKRPQKPKTNEWFNSDCVKLKNRLKNLSNLFTKNPKDPYIRGKLSVVRKEYRKVMKMNKTNFEIRNIEELQKLSNNPKEFWSHIKKINNKNKQSNSNNIPSDIWVEHFSSLNKKDPANDPMHKDYCAHIEDKVNNLLKGAVGAAHCEITDRPFTYDEIKWGLKKMKKGKASGLDGVSNDILVCCAESIIPTVTILFNRLIKCQHFPNQWSISVMVPIHKGGELDDPNNYRGISLNSCLSKLFTLLLNTRITQLCEENNIIHENQIGFRKGYRTSDHVLTLKTLVDQAFQKKEKLYVCFIDFKKAYDMVWRNGLYLKLLKYGVSSKFVNLIKDMYSKLLVSINVLDGLSIPFKSHIGLKQGCNLSPILFNIFINDLVDMIGYDNMDSPFLGPKQVSCLLYADDLILISESKEGLQKSIDKLSQFTKEWFLEVNIKKTKCMVFAKGRPNKIPPIWKLNGKPMEVCDSYCYLGVTFTRSGSLKPAAQILNEKAVGAMFSLIRNTNKHGACSIDIMMELFDKMIVPIALYNCEVWGVNDMFPQDPKKECNPISIKKLSDNPTENIQFKFLKIILRLPSRTSNWATISEVGKYPLTLKIIKQICKFYIHLTQSSSSIIQAVIKTNKALASKGYHSYYSYIERIFKLAGVSHLLYTCDPNEIEYQIDCLDKSLVSIYKKCWVKEQECFKLNSKLELFSEIKESFEMAEYVKTIKNPKHRAALTKVRLSAHKYPIETGRYENKAREDRDCPLCCKSIGDEDHYLFECCHPFIKKACAPIRQQLLNLNPSLKNMGSKSRMKFLINNHDFEIIQLVGKLCFITQEKFKEITY